jgi:hypothetical protein
MRHACLDAVSYLLMPRELSSAAWTDGGTQSEVKARFVGAHLVICYTSTTRTTQSSRYTALKRMENEF